MDLSPIEQMIQDMMPHLIIALQNDNMQTFNELMDARNLARTFLERVNKLGIPQPEPPVPPPPPVVPAPEVPAPPADPQPAPTADVMAHAGDSMPPQLAGMTMEQIMQAFKQEHPNA